ncbi:hypothetical protein A2U01_0085509, partial [Trifolium medium]|nr:hypothetical protein [Trifolium medium]
ATIDNVVASIKASVPKTNAVQDATTSGKTDDVPDATTSVATENLVNVVVPETPEDVIILNNEENWSCYDYVC